MITDNSFLPDYNVDDIINVTNSNQIFYRFLTDTAQYPCGRGTKVAGTVDMGDGYDNKSITKFNNGDNYWNNIPGGAGTCDEGYDYHAEAIHFGVTNTSDLTSDASYIINQSIFELLDSSSEIMRIPLPF